MRIRQHVIREDRINGSVRSTALILNATLMQASIGVDASRPTSTIWAENAVINGNSIVGRWLCQQPAWTGFTAMNRSSSPSHCENGEACLDLRWTCTILRRLAYHKSSLPIAACSRFQRGLARTRQPPRAGGHASGRVRLQGVYRAPMHYVAGLKAFYDGHGAPLLHHDTSAFPYSYLIRGRASACPMNCQTSRLRRRARDIEVAGLGTGDTTRCLPINFEQLAVSQAPWSGYEPISTTRGARPDAPYTYKHTIQASHAPRRRRQYNVVALGDACNKGSDPYKRSAQGYRWHRQEAAPHAPERGGTMAAWVQRLPAVRTL